MRDPPGREPPTVTGPTGDPDNALATNYLTETVVTAATLGFGDVSAPSETTLEAEPFVARIGGGPTAEQLSGSRESRERIESLAALLQFDEVPL
jgi:hypothetical protein